jgi:hypothetical protein
MVLNSALRSLNSVDDLARPGQTLHHLLAFFPSPDSVLALLEQIIQVIGLVHVFKKFGLHLILRVSIYSLVIV